MTPGVPRLAAVVVALATTGRAMAQDAQEPERRQVAVIDLSEDDQVAELSRGIYKALNLSDVLRNPDKREFDQYLTGALYDEDKAHVETARAELGNAERLLSTALDAKGAELHAREGQRELALATPTPETQVLYADLELVLGLAALDQHKAQEANLALAFVHRLDPARQLDPVRYPPDTLTAFKRASETKPVMVGVEIRGRGRVWIDFVERGPAPGTFENLETGEHVIVVTGADRMTEGMPVTLDAVTTITIKDTPATDELAVKRARLELSRAQTKRDDVGRASAMKKLAALLGVGDVVMISKREGRLQWETWRDRAPGFSAPKPYTSQKPEDLLDGIAPPRKQVEPKVGPQVPFKGPIVIEKAWYEERWVQASAAATVVTAIIGGILWARRDKPQQIDMDIKPVGSN